MLTSFPGTQEVSSSRWQKQLIELAFLGLGQAGKCRLHMLHLDQELILTGINKGRRAQQLAHDLTQDPQGKP